MKKIITVSIIALSLAFATQGFATSSAKKKTSEVKPNTPVETKKETQSKEFRGLVKNSTNGPSLITDDGIYLLTGGNFDDLIDQEVKILGDLVTEDDVTKIQVAIVKAATE